LGGKIGVGPEFDSSRCDGKKALYAAFSGAFEEEKKL